MVIILNKVMTARHIPSINSTLLGQLIWQVSCKNLKNVRGWLTSFIRLIAERDINLYYILWPLCGSKPYMAWEVSLKDFANARLPN